MVARDGCEGTCFGVDVTNVDTTLVGEEDVVRNGRRGWQVAVWMVVDAKSAVYTIQILDLTLVEQ